MNMDGFKSVLLVPLLLITIPAQANDTMSLKAFLEKVREQNLDLKIEAAKSNAADAKAMGIHIPPPMAAVTQMKEDNGHTTSGYEVSQTIPFPTKLWGDKSARNYEAKSQEETRLGKENETMAQARFLYFSLWSTEERLAILKKRKAILEDHIRLARSSARSDSFAEIHLLKSESDLDLLENEILNGEQNLREKQTEAAIFISDEPTVKIKTEEPPLSTIPNINSIAESHQIKSLKFNLKSLSSRELELKSSWLPDVNLRYKEVGSSSMASRYNEVMIGVTIPFVFFWEPYATSRQATEHRAQAEYELTKEKRIAEAERTNLFAKAAALKKQLATLQDKLIPRAKKRVQLAHNLAPRDMETLQDHREAMEAFPELKMKALEIRMEYEQAVANLKKYVINKGPSL